MIEPKELEPGALIPRLGVLLRRVLGERSVLTISLNSSGWVRVDASQLEQVVLNLITNARDSLSDRGNVVPQTSDVVLGPADASRHDLSPGPYVVTTVADDGDGIATSAVPQIFEPFFSTRRGGTGLGLATCYGIVKQSGGHIAVQSAPGHGATFSVYLPRAASTGAVASTAAMPAPSAGGSERLLLVEDEAIVRGVVERTLSRASYQVVVATNGDEALLLTDDDGPFDLLITDVLMPGVNGWELGRRLRERWPGLRVLYISGYTEDVVKDGGVVDPSVPFLQKPFLPADLLAQVRKLLDAPSA